MSTRATIHFHYNNTKKAVAIVYRHDDGYPEGLGSDLQEFFEEVRKNVQDTRFTDPSYLAAKWVAWDAKRHVVKYSLLGKDPVTKPAHYLDFLSVGVVMSDPGDIEYRYHVYCDGKPTLTCEKAEGKSVALTAEATC